MTEKWNNENQEEIEQTTAKHTHETVDDDEHTADLENQFLYPSIEPHYRNDVK